MAAYRTIEIIGEDLEIEVEFSLLRKLEMNSLEIFWDKSIYDQETNNSIKLFLDIGRNYDDLLDELLEQYSDLSDLMFPE